MVKSPAPRATPDLPEICPVYHRAVEIIGARWSGAILQVMLNGATRFGAIEGAIPELTSRMLSQRLKELEAEALVERVVTPDTPVRVEYQLTPKGQALAPVVRALSVWAEKWASPPRLRKR
ncbi:MAG: winged helix-turn-helix transcriptional regulator [Alphaproteobacteria bacterium]